MYLKVVKMTSKNILTDPKTGLWSTKQLSRMYPQVRGPQLKEYALNKAATINKHAVSGPTRTILAKKIDQQWVTDLMVVQDIAHHNDGYLYILVVVDVLSRYVWARPLRRKTQREVINAFKDIFSEGRIPKKIQTDQGGEFTGNTVTKFFHNHGVHPFIVSSDMKAALAERFHRTLRMLMKRYFDSHHTLRWVDVLQDLIYNYNHKVHSTIKMAPADVNDEESEKKAYQALLDYDAKKKIRKGKPKYKVGDIVRISRVKGAFEKEDTNNFTEELFEVVKVKMTRPFTYILKGIADDEPLVGSFYEHEMVLAKKEESYHIEEIIDTRGRGKNKEVLIKFVGYPHPEWHPASYVEDL